MVDLPHRFVPTTSKFVSPVRIVMQSGHGSRIVAVAFSPCARFFASADEDGCVRIWAIETLDILGIYRPGFVCRRLSWDGAGAVNCHGEDREYRIELFGEDESADAGSSGADDISGRVIRLLGAPEFECCGDVLTIRYNDEETEHVVPGLFHAEMDPCERFVAAVSPEHVYIFDVFSGEVLIQIDAPAERTWFGCRVYWRGDFVTALLDDGSIYQAFPMDKKRSCSCVLKGSTTVTACDLSGRELVIYGDIRGNLSVYDIVKNSLNLKTPRRPREFSAMYPTADRVGFVALRSESATSFFSQSQEILPAAPLPAELCASCSGTEFSQVVAACADRAVYRLKLDENAISKVCVLERCVRKMASGCDALFVYDEAGKMFYGSGRTLQALNWNISEEPVALAVSDNQKTLACLTSDRVEIFDTAGKKDILSVAVSDGAQIIFGKEKSANTLMLFKNDMSVWTIDIRSGELRECSRLAVEHGRVLSVAPAAKSYAFVLVEAEHGQLVVLKVGLNTGKSNPVLRVFAMGTQIWGASTDDQSVQIRNDATCLRIIQGLKAFSLEDWARSEPLSIF